MCEISDKITFCTCVDANTDIYELEHYWVLHRRNKNKNLIVEGIAIFPAKPQPRYGINEALLLNALNAPDAFDKNIELKRLDRLEVVLCNNSENGDELAFSFCYSGKVWETVESDPFELMGKFDTIVVGGVGDNQ